MASLHGARVPRLTGLPSSLIELPGEGYLLIRFLAKTHRGVYMLDRVARLTGAPCLLARGTRLAGVAFCHVNGSSRAISANRGEINRENMAARSEYFRSYHLPPSVICRTE